MANMAKSAGRVSKPGPSTTKIPNSSFKQPAVGGNRIGTQQARLLRVKKLGRSGK